MDCDGNISFSSGHARGENTVKARELDDEFVRIRSIAPAGAAWQEMAADLGKSADWSEGCSAAFLGHDHEYAELENPEYSLGYEMGYWARITFIGHGREPE